MSGIDPTVLEKLDAVMSDPSLGDKINAIISGTSPAAKEKGDAPKEQPSSEDSGYGSSPPAEMRSAGGLPCGGACETQSPPPPCPCKPPPPPCSTVKNGRALLLALKPYMDEKRCEKIDKILSAMKLAEMFETMSKIL